jgi:hypothetical protein
MYVSGSGFGQLINVGTSICTGMDLKTQGVDFRENYVER